MDWLHVYITEISMNMFTYAAFHLFHNSDNKKDIHYTSSIYAAKQPWSSAGHKFYVPLLINLMMLVLFSI